MSTAMEAPVRIDAEFRSLIPPLTPEERAQLEANILEEGCREKLVVWRGILLDGHNRYAICQQHDVPFETREIDLPDRETAYDWIINNQLGRRNLTPDQASYLRGKRYNHEKGGAHRPAKKLPQNEGVKLGETAGRLAEEFNVSRATVERDGQYAAALDTLAENTGEDTKQAILSGAAKVTKKTVIELAKQPAEKQKEVARDLSVHFSSATPEWYTPQAIIDRVLQAFGGAIDLDPCSNSHDEPNVPAAEHFTAEDDGLNRRWDGTVYMNPPYGRELSEWIEKLVAEYRQGNTTEAIALVPSRTDTEWFRKLKEYPRCFVWGRLKFSGSDNSAPFPSMVVYLGKSAVKFARAFSDIGDVYKLA